MDTNPTYAVIKPNIVSAIRAYADKGHPTGSFLRAVLANDLMEATGRADDDNRLTLWNICCYVHNEIPGRCHGSYEIVDAWVAKHEAKKATAHVCTYCNQPAAGRDHHGELACTNHLSAVVLDSIDKNQIRGG